MFDKCLYKMIPISKCHLRKCILHLNVAFEFHVRFTYFATVYFLDLLSNIGLYLQICVPIIFKTSVFNFLSCAAAQEYSIYGKNS